MKIGKATKNLSNLILINFIVRIKKDRHNKYDWIWPLKQIMKKKSLANNNGKNFMGEFIVVQILVET